MYPQFFGFEKLPFRLRPDPDFLYPGPEYLRARAKVLTGLRSSSRLILLMGPAGVGKTMLLEDILREIAGQYALCRINQPHLSAAELVQALSLQLGAPADADADQPRPYTDVAASIDSAGTRDAAPLLIVDDAQLLAAGTLHTFGEILSRAPRLKVLLAGKDGQWQRVEAFGLRTKQADEPRQVRLAPLSAEGTKAYIERRLAIAGGGGKELFTPDAYAMIFLHTAGAARLINVLCDAALHAACTRAAGHVTGAEILLATQDSRWPEAVARDRASSSAPVNAPMEDPAQAAYAQLVVSHRSIQVAVLPLESGRTSIGRAIDNSLRLDAPYISRHHCYVETIGHVSTIEDLGSVNGICVNGTVVKRRVLQHADKITLGEHELTYLVR
jgi:type II secretory pathway predicted ATPase ExeA